uniref:Uncharacterized protein n=1 Tax=Kalanchoe fedtschenkoi TaxID=63787 RepID=A0A7N0VM80_KALFE
MKIVRLVRNIVVGGEGNGMRRYQLTLSGIEIGSKSDQIGFGKEGSLKEGVDDMRLDAIDGAKLGLLNLMVHHPSFSRHLGCLLMVKHHIDLESFGRTYGLRSVGKSYIC